MGEDYENWLMENLDKETVDDYVEPSIQELVQMMDALPKPTIEGSNQWQ